MTLGLRDRHQETKKNSTTKVFAASVAVTAVVGFLPSTLGWWDNGHMLVSEVATQLMDSADVATIESILSRWDEDFPNTGEITTAALWMDIAKCTAPSSTCTTPASPSITSMSDWHYVDLPLNIKGDKWEDKDADLSLFDDTMGGDGVSVIEGAMKFFKTTKSKWAANLFMRNFIHIYFVSLRAFSNLHAVWDAAVRTTGLSTSTTSTRHATELIALLLNISDNLHFTQYETVTFEEFTESWSPTQLCARWCWRRTLTPTRPCTVTWT